MKNFANILIIIGVIVIFVGFLGGFNFNSLSDARKIKIGMPVDSLKVIMGEPFQIEVNQDNEYWHFKYNHSWDGNNNGMRVKIVSDTIADFYSY